MLYQTELAQWRSRNLRRNEAIYISVLSDVLRVAKQVLYCTKNCTLLSNCRVDCNEYRPNNSTNIQRYCTVGNLFAVQVSAHAKLSYVLSLFALIDYESWIINLLLDVLLCSIAALRLTNARLSHSPCFIYKSIDYRSWIINLLYDRCFGVVLLNIFTRSLYFDSLYGFVKIRHNSWIFTAMLFNKTSNKIYLQANQVKRTPQDYINELIVWKLSPGQSFQKCINELIIRIMNSLFISKINIKLSFSAH